jgi:UDP-2,4-diacetamido-2,4,6-trideoxy-beta-L-altropyranose hydrolase
VSFSKLRVALRADASPIIGLGHVKRCLSLASALCEAGAQVRLISRDLGVDVSYLLRDTGVAHTVLTTTAVSQTIADFVPHATWAGIGWQEDAVQTADVLREWQPAWVVVDEYAFDARWHRFVSAQLGSRIAVIDDLADRDLFADLLVDHNYHKNHREKYLGCVEPNTAILGGPRFALLGPSYAHAKPFSVRKEVESIGIFMGGTDPSDLSSVVLRACREFVGFTGVIEIVATRSYAHVEKLNALAAKWPNTSISCDLPDLSDFFSRHDLQIGAGGGATWERCCVGVPTLLIIAADNQRAVLPALADMNVADVLEDSASFNEEMIAKSINALLRNYVRRSELNKQCRKIVDGLGARRVSLWFAASAIAVRPASVDDSEMMYQWRNDPATRSMSRSSKEIEWLEHVQWLSSTLGDPKRYLLIGYAGSISFGVIRFDIDDACQAEVSLYLDPRLHGLGLGKAMLRASEAYVLVHNANIVAFKATVLDGNLGSMNLFKSGGYQFRCGVWTKSFTSQLNS